MEGDWRLAARAAGGDRAALEELCRSTWQPVYRYLRHRVGDASLAEDLTQEVYVRVLPVLPSFRERGVPLVGVLLRVARNLAVSDWRRRRPAVPLDEDPADADPSPEEEAYRREEREELLEALARLTDQQRRVLTLRFWEERSVEDTARILGCAAPAVRSLQYRGLKALRRILEGKGDGR